MQLLEGWDIVMDGSDNAATRYLISDACVIAKKVLVSGSALQWEG
jgi:adenylyltransferase/sulfurtransferase